MGIKKLEENKGDGLALLLNSEPSTYESLGTQQFKSSHEQLRSATAYVLGLSDQEAIDAVGETVNWDVTRRILRDRLKDVDQCKPRPIARTDGRLGPEVVLLHRASISGDLRCGEDGLTLESLANFSSCRGSTCVFKGRWMYEATIGTAGIQQIGWATVYCPFTNEEGVGDAPDSYAYDGKRVRKWSVKSEAYGENWAPGDVIGCCLDLDAATLTFYRNGHSLGVAYSSIRTMQPHLAYFPAVSLSSSERCELNFGAHPFQYPVEGYRPLQEPPAQDKQAAVTLLLSCFQRLVTVADGERDIPTPGLLFPRLSLPTDESNLLASLVWEDLGAKIDDNRSYLVSSHLLPFLLDLYGRAEPHRPGSLATALKFMERCLAPAQLAQTLGLVLETLARLCRMARLVPEDFPHSAAYPYLSLVCALVRHDVVGRLWLSHPQFHLLLEGFITRKPPTSEDLKTIFPQVWWRGARGDEANNEEALRAAAKGLAAAVAKVEERQFELLTWLLDKPAFPSPLTPGRPAATPSNAFVAFLNHVLLKNRDSVRDVQPPGLSDQTVLTTMYYVLLRLLRPHFDGAATGEGPLASFPVESIFLKVASDTDPMVDVSRLGGLLSHLLREVPVGRTDRAALQVSAPYPLEPCAADTGVAAKLPQEQLPGVLNSTLLLYSWRVGSNLRMAQQFAQQLAGSCSSLEEVERHLQRDAISPDYMQYLGDIRQQLREDIHTNVRYLTLCQVVFLSKPKQEAMFAMAAYVASLLLAAVKRQSLLGYIPTCYVESLLDLTAALRRTESPFATAPQLLAHGLHAFISLFCRLIDDSRVANPDVRESVLNLLGSALDTKEYVEAFAHNEDAREHLVRSVMASFDSRYWHPISIILLRLVKGTGLGQGGAPEHLTVFQQAMATAVSSKEGISKPFLNKLFNMLNWGFTEFSVIISELHDGRSRSRSHGESHAQNTMRKAVIMFELSVGLLRILEFVATQAPATFIPQPNINMSRLQELLGFVLTHLTSGPDARRLSEVLQQPRFAPLSDKVARTSALAPLINVLLGLWQAGTAAGAKVGEFEAALVRSGDPRLVEYLEATAALDWTTAYPADTALAARLVKFQELLAGLRTARGHCENTAAEDAAMEAEIPDDFLDPITMTLMHDPVVLPDSQVAVDRSTIERHLLTSATDPFSRKELQLDQLIPATELKGRITAWLAQRRNP